VGDGDAAADAGGHHALAFQDGLVDLLAQILPAVQGEHADEATDDLLLRARLEGEDDRLRLEEFAEIHDGIHVVKRVIFPGIRAGDKFPTSAASRESSTGERGSRRRGIEKRRGSLAATTPFSPWGEEQSVDEFENR
jgi:hypothetical protein